MRRLIRLLPAFIYMGVIFYLSSQQAPALAVSDKVLHFMAYGALAAMLIFGLAGSMPPPRVAVVSAVVSFLYGCSDELHQSYVAGRSAELLDALADGGGSALVALVYVLGRWMLGLDAAITLPGVAATTENQSPPGGAGLAHRERVG